MSPAKQKRLAAVLCAATVAVFLGMGCEKKAPPPAPPPAVQVLTVKPEDVPIVKEWIGTLQGNVNAEIRAEVTGYLLAQDYVEGSEVKKGQLLFQIDPRPFQAALDQVEGKLAQDKAQQGKTQLDVNRFTPLAKVNAISQQELDDAIQANLAAEAALKADQAAVENAQLNLSFTKITSPIDGLAGIAQAQIGDLVGLNSGVLTTVSAIDPIRVYFNVSEQSYIAYRRQYTNAIARAVHESDLELHLILSDGSTYPYEGKFFFVSRQVDVNTGTLQIAGLFPNPDFVLRPGQYALVRARTGMQHDAILVPQRAVTELQGTYMVDTVGESNKVHLQTVSVGDQIGADWIVSDGLKGGERVIVEGLQKVKEGTAVTVQPYTPSASETNQPAGATGDTK